MTEDTNTPLVDRLGTWSYQHPWRVLVTAIAALVGLTALAGQVGGEFRQSFALPGSEALAAAERLEGAGFDGASGYQGYMVVAADDVRAAPVQNAVEVFLDSVEQDVQGAELSSEELEVSSDGTVGLAIVDLGPEAAEAQERARRILSLHESYQVPEGASVEFGGEPFQQDSEFSSEGIGLAAALIILLVAFGSIWAAGLPIVTALVGIGCAVAVVQIAARFIDIPPFTPGIVAMIGIGAGIDYALFILTRFREEKQQGRTEADTVAKAISTAGRATVFAGATVVVSLLGLLVVGLDDVRAVALAAAAGVLFVMLASISVLPALLRPIGRKMSPLGTTSRPSDVSKIHETIWYRWSRFIQGRPRTAMVLCLLVLVLLAVPAADLRLGLSDAGNRPEGDSARRAYDLITEGFGPGYNGPLFLAVDVTDSDEQAVGGILDTVRADPGVESVAAPVIDGGGTTALVQVIPTTGPQHPETAELVHRLRNITIGAQTSDSEVLVGGGPAAVVDFSDHNARILPWFIGAVLALSFMLLMTVFRSLLVPLKAVILNLLSVGAAYGIVVAVFQWGWFSEILGVGEPGPVEAWVPMMMFAIVFGLSMDYEVFLLSRIKEEHTRTGDNASAVANGIARTARLISAAAAIMVCVFGAFVLSGDRSLQMMGLGLSAAIAVDATLVRLVLVPATMEVLGDRNWWLPRWIDHRLPDIQIESPHARHATTRP